jgi:uncharacterized DUF497 family protein
MDSISFSWDPLKEKTNTEKHGVSFTEAQTVFYDENGILIHDPNHSEEEDRFIILGMSSSLRLLLVCHCYRESDRNIRIISARKAWRNEARQYEERR